MSIGKIIAAGAFMLVATGTLGQRGQRFVVLPANAAPTIPARIMGDVDSHGSWQPNEADIDGLEANLAQISKLNIRGWKTTLHIEHPE